ncbi:Fe-S cluster assembly protein SufB [Bacteriovorax stolpii]|uniref:Fe-S cluster assembly protein SufB n=1 Tax=Bacteriovorax stolpii TaxID=960 RepID=A0A2K9NS76_BACTC|nr:Fe-S cluster assembly protein SufB [Bacteriovorax stolpii]AUN97945.1 Fe-S cluster assembly protein SufB [Bacteriovorax stolpii]QDK42069.1 Fe-S cluster assembly protein SufB [Bacteriovorax stolpii]TDP51778.1 iron-regulated ABC transporter membrane component SufB [Bacteriovorax stolpii]
MSTDILNSDYKYGFFTDIETEEFPKGLNEDIIRMISAKKEEPEWLLNFRLKAYRHWLTMEHPKWAKLNIPEINYQDLYYYSAPKKKDALTSLDEIDPELLATFEKLGIPLNEQKRISGVAVDAVFDSVSVATTHKEELEKVGVIFCSISEAVKEHPELVKKYLGTVVPHSDNFYAALNAAVFSDGSFVFIPKGVRCPLDLSTYFRINAKETGQFERTLIIAEEGSFVNYLEGCTAPQRDENQLHAAIVELVALDDAEIKYSTVQNWYAGDKEGKGGIYNFVTKRGNCLGKNSKISWTQVEAGSAITWKYPSCNLIGDGSEGAFYSVALTNNFMQADTGTKMVHIGKNTKSTIISKGISAEQSENNYRGLVKINPSATGARNYSQCDSMLIGDKARANTFPYIDVKNNTAVVEHEASTSKISEEQLFYLQSRGLSEEKCISMIVNGFCKDVFKELPLEFSVEAVKLIEMKLENSIG